MFGKKNYLLNCEVCDTRKMKEEDYSSYEKMIINADVVVVSEKSKSILNRLPLTLNHDCIIEVGEEVDVPIKTINGSYEITGATMVQDHTLIIVNGTLKIHPNTEEVLKKYERIHVNGSVQCPKSLEGYLNGLTVNGAVSMYPDDCVILDDSFLLGKYFPLRAKAGKKYYAQNEVIIQDRTVDLEKLIEKKAAFVTKKLILPEEKVETCCELFDEDVEFVVVPEGMNLHYGDVVLNETLLEKEGGSLFLYGDMELEDGCDMVKLKAAVQKIIVKGNLKLYKSQEKELKTMNLEYDKLSYKWEGRMIENKPAVRIDNVLLESSPNKVLVKNAAMIKIAEDVTAELILDRLVIENAAKVSCKEEQESAVAAVAKNVAKIGNTDGTDQPDFMEQMKNMLSTKMINADRYVM